MSTVLIVIFIMKSFNRSDQANKCFSSAVQLHDNLVKAWAAWGDYLDQLFATEKYSHNCLPPI